MRDLSIEEIVALTLSPNPRDVLFIVDYIGLISLGHIHLLRSFTDCPVNEIAVKARTYLDQINQASLDDSLDEA